MLAAFRSKVAVRCGEIGVFVASYGSGMSIGRISRLTGCPAKGTAVLRVLPCGVGLYCRCGCDCTGDKTCDRRATSFCSAMIMAWQWLSSDRKKIIFVLLPAVSEDEEGGRKDGRWMRSACFGASSFTGYGLVPDHSKSLGEVMAGQSWRFSIGVARMASLGRTEYVASWADARRGQVLVRCTGAEIVWRELATKW